MSKPSRSRPSSLAGMAAPKTAPPPATSGGPLVRNRKPSREGKQVRTIALTPEQAAELKALAMRLSCTMHALIVEGINDVLSKHRGAGRKGATP